jgi:hypothetical protein
LQTRAAIEKSMPMKMLTLVGLMLAGAGFAHEQSKS